MIAEFEKRVQLPPNAPALSCYRRYYSLISAERFKQMWGVASEPDFREVLIGTYRLPEAGQQAGIEWVSDPEDVPVRHDSGCGTLNATYVPEFADNDFVAECSADIAGSIPKFDSYRLPAENDCP